jgi:hypothetical protein
LLFAILACGPLWVPQQLVQRKFLFALHMQHVLSSSAVQALDAPLVVRQLRILSFVCDEWSFSRFYGGSECCDSRLAIPVLIIEVQ